MDDDGPLYTIGELARRTGLAVRTIRFYSDSGVLPPTDRTPAGHRLYGIGALTRLELVRTLRELGIDLPTIQRVLGPGDHGAPGSGTRPTSAAADSSESTAPPRRSPKATWPPSTSPHGTNCQ